MTQTFTTPRPAAGKGDNTNILIIALVMGVLAVVLNLLYVYYVRSSAAQRTFTVYTLNRNVIRGEQVRAGDFIPHDVPDSFAGTFRQLRWVGQNDITAYQHFERPATMGDAVTTDLFNADSGTPMDSQIPEDQLDVSLPVNSRTVPGMLRKGMYVDISAPFLTGSSGVPTIYRVLENVKVLAIGKSTIYDQDSSGAGGARPAQSFSTIDILIKRDDWPTLALIEHVVANGEFELAIRNPSEHTHSTGASSINNRELIDYIGKLRNENHSDTPTMPRGSSNR